MTEQEPNTESSMIGLTAQEVMGTQEAAGENASEPISTGKWRLMGLLAAVLAPVFGLKGNKAQAEEGKEAVNPLLVEIPNVVVPVADGRRLVNYLFFNVRLTAANAASGAKIRTLPYLAQDAIIRSSGRNPTSYGATPGTYNAAGLRAMIKASVESGLQVQLARVEIRNARFMNG